MAESQIMSSDTALYINLYTEAEASVYIGDSRADVKITGDYLADSKAKIFIDFTGRPCAVKLRIPKWSENSVVRIDGEVFDAESGYFTVIPKKKQCAIEIVFDNSVVITYIPTTAEKTTDQWKIEKFFGKWMDNPNLEDMFLYEGRCVLRKGAVLLCRSKLCGSTKEEMFNTDLLIDESYECKLSRTTPSDGINLQFDATFTNGIKEFSATVCDYASGTNMIFDDMYSFSIYF